MSHDKSSRTETEGNFCERALNKIKNSIKFWRKNIRAELKVQILLTYGIMLAILVFLLVIKGVLPDKMLSGFDVWGMGVSAFAPTTITFIACLMQTDQQIQKNRVNAGVLYFLVILISLGYITFEAINTAERPCATALIGFVIGVLVPCIAVYLLCKTTVPAKDNDIDSQSDDGCISAKMGGNN